MPFVVASTTIDKIQNTHIGDMPPVVPTVGQLWNDTTQQPPLLKMWNGIEWEVVHTSIKQLDPVAFEDINKMIDDAISGAEQDRNKIQEAIDKANNALQQAGLNDTKITEIKQIQSEDGKKINQIQVNYNGLQQSVKDLDGKTESYHTQLSGQINDVVKEQGNLSQQIQTAEGNISSVQDSQNNMNRELQTAKETINQISSKTDSNTELINTVKQTSDSNSQKIVDTSGKVSVVEQTLNEQKQTIADNTGKINKATQDIDSANRTISNIDGRVSQVEQKADGITTTVSRVETELNNKADASYVDNKINDISVGGTNILLNTEKMDNDNIWTSDGTVVVENGVATIRQGWGGREYRAEILNEYLQEHDFANKKYMFSADVMRSTESVLPGSKIQLFCNQIQPQGQELVPDLSALPLNKWVRVECEISFTGLLSGDEWGKRFRIECNTDNEWKFRHMKLEEGTKATDWSPSPLDFSNAIDGLSKGAMNCWINSNFSDGYNHWIRNTPNITLYTNETYNGTKVLDMISSNGSSWEFVGTERYKVEPGEKISFGWLQNKISGDQLYGELQLYPNETDTRNGILSFYTNKIGEWEHIKKEGYIVPDNVHYVGFNFYINGTGRTKYTQFQLVHNEKLPPYQPSANDLNNAQSEINQQLQSQQTQINQKPDRTEIIASSNENPRAYFKVGTFSDGPNFGRGYVSVGADYGFFLNTNTFIADSFILSAKHISAGQLMANTPAWIISSKDTWKVDKNSYVTKYDLDNSNIFLGPTGMTNNAFTAMSLKNGGIQFLYDNNGNTRAGFKTVGYMFPSVTNSSIPEIQILGASEKYGLSIVGDDTAPYGRLSSDKSRVYIGKDALAGDGTAAIASNTVYTWRLQTPKDSDNVGILVDDKLLVEEGVWSKWNNNWKQTHIDFPNRNGGDVIEFHTAEGDGAFNSGYKAYFQMVNGNWKSGKVDAQHHAIVVGGNGYILSFSNNDSTDNAQGDGSATVVATNFVTNSSKELKTDIQPINNIDQAVKDILKIEPKQYLYQSQVDQLSKWENNGKPADTFKYLNTEINVGLIAEEMDEYDSLRPFIEKVTDEEGNEGILGIDYSKLTPLLLAVCQEQDNKINELEERLVRIELLMKGLRK